MQTEIFQHETAHAGQRERIGPGVQIVGLKVFQLDGNKRIIA